MACDILMLRSFILSAIEMYLSDLPWSGHQAKDVLLAGNFQYMPKFWAEATYMKQYPAIDWAKRWRKGLDFGQYMTVVWRIFKMDLIIGLATLCQKYNKYETLPTLFFLSFLFFIGVRSELW